MRILLTNHAVEQFITRHAPNMAGAEAEEALNKGLETAVRLREQTLLGHDRLFLKSLGIIAVVKRDDRNQANKYRTICVTVLPAKNEDLDESESDESEPHYMYMGFKSLAVKMKEEKAITLAHFEEELKEIAIRFKADKEKTKKIVQYSNSFAVLKRLVKSEPYSPDWKDALFKACVLIDEIESK